MAKKYFKTVNGVNGINLNKIVEFITGETSVNYEFDENEKTFVFYIKKEYNETKQGKAMLSHFVNFYNVIVKFV